jgi:hypothetical protein
MTITCIGDDASGYSYTFDVPPRCWKIPAGFMIKMDRYPGATLAEVISSNEPTEWSGSGLPPVGAVCEFAGGTPCPEDPFDKDLREGMKVTIIAHFKCGDFTLAAFTFDPENPYRGMVQVEQGNFSCFRPIRTPEQIDAEDRDKAINQMEFDTDCMDRGAFTKLYDAGWRKQATQ